VSVGNKSLTAFPSKRIAAVGQLPEKYITGEYGKLSMHHKKWHISSRDAIESLF
jgi:hypothetical protein